MLGFRKRSSSRSGGRAHKPAPARSTVETLERRALLSVSATPNPFDEAFFNHTLTEEQLEERGWVSMEWQGQLVYAVAGEWLVGLERSEPTFRPDGTLLDLNVDWVGHNEPAAPELQHVFDKSSLGITFDEYIGAKDLFVIQAPESVTYERLHEALRGIDKFKYVEPSTIGRGGGAGEAVRGDAPEGVPPAGEPTAGGLSTAEWTDDELMDATQRHTLTPEQMAALDFVELEWGGRLIYAKAGEWILGFEHESPIFDDHGNLIDLNIDFAGPFEPAPDLQQRFDALGVGIRFDHYLGVKHQVLIDVPPDLTFERLSEALRELPDFAYVEPNAAGPFPTGAPNSPGTPGAPSAAPAAEWTDEELMEATRRHTLTPEQMAALDLVEIEWKGQPIYAKAGEWTVGFEHEPPTFDDQGNLIDLNIEFAGPNTPGLDLQQRFDQLGLGIRFDRYLGVKHQVSIDAPRDLTFEQLNEALQLLPDFAYVEPNSVSIFPTAAPNDPSVGETPVGGNVAVSVSGGRLSIRGDGAASAVAVAAGAAAGEFVVSGAPGTTINGQAAAVTLTGVTRGLRARLGAGDDRLSVTAPALPGDVSLDLGRGTDTLTLDGVAVGRNLSVRGAAGAKTLDLSRVTVSGRTSMATGADADAVNLVDSIFTGRATIRAGDGDDTLTGSATFASGRSINDGRGDDTVTIIDGA